MRVISHLRSRTAMLWMLLVALILSGCGGQGQDAPMFRANPARTGVFPSNGPTTLNELAWKFKTDGMVNSSPAVADGVVYVGSGDGRLYALDARTGKEKWSFNTGGEVFSSPAVADGVVYAGVSE
jgi:outer membrane protein assembly factor BamB